MDFHFPFWPALVCAYKCFIGCVSQNKKCECWSSVTSGLIWIDDVCFPVCNSWWAVIPSKSVQKKWGEEGQLCLGALTEKERWPWHSGSLCITWRVCGAGLRWDALWSVILLFPFALSALMCCCVLECFASFVAQWQARGHVCADERATVGETVRFAGHMWHRFAPRVISVLVSCVQTGEDSVSQQKTSKIGSVWSLTASFTLYLCLNPDVHTFRPCAGSDVFALYNTHFQF